LVSEQFASRNAVAPGGWLGTLAPLEL